MNVATYKPEGVTAPPKCGHPQCAGPAFATWKNDRRRSTAEDGMPVVTTHEVAIPVCVNEVVTGLLNANLILENPDEAASEFPEVDDALASPRQKRLKRALAALLLD